MAEQTIDQLVQELIDAAIKEGGAAAQFVKPMQPYYEATVGARIELEAAIDQLRSANVPPQSHAETRWAVMALHLVRNKLTAMGLDPNDTAMLNLDAAEKTLTSNAGVRASGEISGEQARDALRTVLLVGHFSDDAASTFPAARVLSQFIEQHARGVNGTGGNDA